MKTPFAPQGTPLIKISCAELERPCFVSVPNMLDRALAADTTNFTGLNRMLKVLMQFAPAPWRQYWAVNALTPEVQYLGEFSDPSTAQEALEGSGFLRRDEMFVVNCAGAASLLISGKELQAVHRYPVGFKATVCDNINQTSRVEFFEAPVAEAQEIARHLFSRSVTQNHVVGICELREFEDPLVAPKTYVATFQYSNRMFGQSPPWDEEFQATTLRDAQSLAGLKSCEHPDKQLIAVRLKD